MADIGEAISSINPFGKGTTTTSVAQTAVSWIGYFILFLVVCAIVGFLTWYIMNLRKFNKRIVIWARVGNNWEEVAYDRATVQKYGTMGDTVWYWKKLKRYDIPPEIQVASIKGKRKYWYAYREDGEYINIGMGDIDLQMKRAGAKFLHAEMRAKRTGLERIMRERGEKKNFLKEYAGIIIPIVAIVIVLIFLYLLFDKFLGLASTLQSMADKTFTVEKEVADKLNNALTSLDRICSSSSGSGYTTGG